MPAVVQHGTGYDVLHIFVARRPLLIVRGFHETVLNFFGKSMSGACLDTLGLLHSQLARLPLSDDNGLWKQFLERLCRVLFAYASERPDSPWLDRVWQLMSHAQAWPNHWCTDLFHLPK